jgi:pimeloyl-ACP methyl ester carboxylesterase
MEEFLFEQRGIYYRRNEFTPDRPTLFFIHGVSGSSAAWLPYEKAFETKYNVLSLDLRGHGKSFKPKKYEDYTIEKFSQDLYELLDYLGVKKCILISHSFGVLVALAFIAEHQDMVSATIFISPHFSVGKMPSARMVWPLLMLGVKIKPELSSPSRIGGHVDYSKYKNTGDWNVGRTIADVKNTGFWIYVYASAQSYALDGEPILKKIKIPTLVIHGAKDTIFPLKYGVMMADAISNAKLVILDDIDHIVVLNKSAEVVGIIDNFIGTLKV